MRKPALLIAPLFCLLLGGGGAGAFTDVPIDDPQAHIFAHLRDVGILGTNRDTLGGQEPVTRAEALTIALRAGGVSIPTEYNPSLLPADVDPNAWYAPSVARAIQLRYIGEQGYEFRPTALVTKAEYLAFLLRTTRTNLNSYERRLSRLPADVDKESWYAPLFAYAQRYQIAELLADQRYRPLDALTRRELALMTYRQLRLFHGDSRVATLVELEANISQFMGLLRADKADLAQHHLQKILDLTRVLSQQQYSAESVAAQAIALAMDHFTDAIRAIKSENSLEALAALHLSLQQLKRVTATQSGFQLIAKDLQSIVETTLTELSLGIIGRG